MSWTPQKKRVADRTCAKFDYVHEHGTLDGFDFWWTTKQWHESPLTRPYSQMLGNYLRPLFTEK